MLGLKLIHIGKSGYWSQSGGASIATRWNDLCLTEISAMDSDPMVGLSGIAGQSSYSSSVPVTAWMYDDIKPVILQAIGK